jgi:hypothetical protein
MEHKINWIFRWKKDPNDSIVFIPFYADSGREDDWLVVAETKDGGSVSDWSTYDVIKEWKRGWPTSHDKQFQIKYVFVYHDYFEGLE